MNHIAVARAREILTAAVGKRVAVLGDYMLDRHLKGVVNRISPEAPVPVVEIETETTGLGGAGNVVQNLASLGVKPYALGIVGEDAGGIVLRGHLEACGADAGGMIALRSRRTTEKVRIIARDQHVVRADYESTALVTDAEADRLLKALTDLLPTLDALILQDYNKGVLTRRVLETALREARAANVPVYVDPKFDNFFNYRLSHVFKPNIRELERALGMRLPTDEALLEAGRLVFERLQPDCLLVTRGEKGMTLFKDRESVQHIPTRARKVHDVSGAGDTVIATYTAVEAAGAGAEEAAVMANYAAGVVCAEVGVVPIQRDQLLQAIEGNE